MDYALRMSEVDIERVIDCWRKYMGIDGHKVPSGEDFAENMNLKMSSSDYLNDMIDILRPGVVFDANDAYVRVKKNVLAKID